MATFGRLLLMVIGVLAVSLLGAVDADARRIALVIGNKGYATAVGPLRNPHNDITLVADALKAAGFEVLEPVREATRARILQAVRLFALRLQAAGPDAVGFLYYSGHGAAIGSQNYLIPVDVDKPDSASLADGGVPQREIINRLAEIAPNAVHYLVIDACRNNLGGTKGPKGFRAEDRRDGMLIAFAAAPDKPASDEGEKSGPFAAALAAELKSPERDDYLLFHRVRVSVDRATRGEQVPWIEDGMRRAERVKLGTPVIIAPPVSVAGPREPVAPVALEWRDVKDSGNRRALEAFLAKHKSEPVYAALAEQALAALQPPPAAPAPRPQPAPAAAITRCTGVEVDVAGRGKQCLDPGDQARREFEDCVTTSKVTHLCMPMVVLPKGTYKRGSEDGEADEKPVSKVTIGYHLGVGKHEVTRGQFAAFVAATGHKTDGDCFTWSGSEWKHEWKQQAEKSWRSPGFGQTDTHPVTCVNWNDAMAFVQWLAKTSGQPYRLLSEAEWEYAARGVTSASSPHPKYHFGDREADLCKYANGADETAKSKFPSRTVAPCADGQLFTAPVGSKEPSAFGLHDTHGNVLEWVEDVRHDSYQGAPADGSSRTAGGDQSRHVLRGGSWYDTPRGLRSADRGVNLSGSRSDVSGFRVARVISR